MSFSASYLTISNISKSIKPKQIRKLFNKLNLGTIKNIQNTQDLYNKRLYIEWINNNQSNQLIRTLKMRNASVYILDNSHFWKIKLFTETDDIPDYDKDANPYLLLPTEISVNIPGHPSTPSTSKIRVLGRQASSWHSWGRDDLSHRSDKGPTKFQPKSSGTNTMKRHTRRRTRKQSWKEKDEEMLLSPRRWWKDRIGVLTTGRENYKIDNPLWKAYL